MGIPLSAPDITQLEIDAVTAVMRTNRLSLGPELERFEAAMATYHAVPEAVAVSSGTAGLHLALLALDIGEGAEVLVPSFAFVAVANAVAYVGATPVFVDIDPVTLDLDPEQVRRAITPRTRAVLVVHTFGIPAEMDRIVAIAQAHGLAVIEDACEALGAEWDGQKVGGFGEAAVFGFYPNKQITTGEGGCVLTRDGAIAERVRTLRNQGRPVSPRGEAPHDPVRTDGSNWFEHVEIGCNYRLSELACALGRVQLSRVDEILGRRRAVAERYHKLLSAIAEPELPPLSLPRRSISWFVYVVRLRSDALDANVGVLRDRVQKAMAARGVATGRYFAPIHLQPAWRGRAASIRLANTESIAPRMLALPFFNRITSNEQEAVAEALVEALAECKRL